MMSLNSQGVSVTPKQATLEVEAQQAVIIGHCPGNVNLQPLLDAPILLALLSLHGFAKQWQKLQFDHEQIELTQSQIKQRLFNLPIPIDSLQMFQAMFPNAQLPLAYSSARERAWLPLGVEDFFDLENGASEGIGDKSQKRLLWVVIVDPRLSQQAFYSSVDDDPLDMNNQGSYSALANALQISAASLLMMPDLERLQLTTTKPSVPRMRLANIKPQFLPCRFDYKDSHRERHHSSEIVSATKPMSFELVIAKILHVLAKQRPDPHFIFSVPYTLIDEVESPVSSENIVLSKETLASIENLQNSELQANLHQMQLVYPYLMDDNGSLRSSAPIVARQILQTTERLGAWRSIARQVLTRQYQIFPQTVDQSTRNLAKTHGIALLSWQQGNICLDEERLANVSTLQKSDFTRSGEVSRFMGWLRRQLEQIALNFIFTFDAQDPRPLLTLNHFFNQLFNAGALQGSRPEDAFIVIQLSSDQQLVFEIALQPVFAIQAIKLHIVNGKLEGMHA